MFSKHISVHTTENNKVLLEHIPAFRQAFVVAALLILSGLFLSYSVHDYFLAVPIMVSGGLLFSGLVGWCPLALVLERMPWNKKRCTDANTACSCAGCDTQNKTDISH